MFRDRIIAGAAIGILADLVKLAFNYLAFSFGFTNVVFWQIAATRFLQKGDLFGPMALLVGGVADLTTTAILGVFSCILSITSEQSTFGSKVPASEWPYG